MYELPVQFDPDLDHRPVWLYVIVVAILWSLPLFNVVCLFGSWCVVQDDDWWLYALMLALPILLFLEFPLRLLKRARGKKED